MELFLILITISQTYSVSKGNYMLTVTFQTNFLKSVEVEYSTLDWPDPTEYKLA